MLRNLLTVGGWTMLSRLLGLVRDQLLAMFLGAGAVQDAYQIAFRLPNMFRRLFGEGALNAAFVPLFTARYEEQGRKQALLLAGQAFSLLLLWLTFLTLLA
ncbi:MAG: lipid II flippase MurJ, partial [Bombella apis]|nr:lipid II flippase MurJ [Bombella apis]